MTAPAVAYVGCRTSRARSARGEGLGVFRMPPDGGAWDRLQVVPGPDNPSFLAMGATGQVLYAVHGDGDQVSAYRIDPATALLEPLSVQSTQGRNPVHLAIDPHGRFIVVTNHQTSTLAVLPLDAEGALGPVCDLVAIGGAPGPHRVEQAHAKPHQAVFDPTGRTVVVPDKGLDQVRVFRLGPAGRLTPTDPAFAPAREASGPRHVAFSPSAACAYVVNELDSTITAYRFDPATGALDPFQRLSTLPDSFTGNSRAAEIAVAPDGRFVYASNRGSDTVAVFAVHPGSGGLSPVQFSPSGGRTPRFFAIDPAGTSLYVANEDSDTIARCSIDPASGRLAPPIDVARTGSPVCILFGPARPSPGD